MGAFAQRFTYLSVLGSVLRYTTITAALLLGSKATLACNQGVAPSAGALRWRSDVIEAGESPHRQKVEVEKAWLTVPRDWNAPTGPTFRLQVMRLRATSPQPGSPIIYLAGGPGGSSTGSVTGDRHPLMQRLRALGDVVAMDQRGVYSEPFPVCRTPVALPLDRAFDPAAFLTPLISASQACVADWKRQGVDLALLDTAQSVRDLQALRDALGSPMVRLLGISYGTHLALSFIREFEGSVDAAVLAGVEGPDHTLKTPEQLEHHLSRLAEAVASSPDGRAILPDPIRAFEEVRLALAAPKMVRTKTKEGAVTVTVGAADLDRALLDMTAERSDIEQFPQRLARLRSGDFEPLAQWAVASRRLRGLLPLAYVADCASGASSLRLSRITHERELSRRFGDINWPFPEICSAWPFKDAGEAFRLPVVSKTRALFISGDLDGRTPRANAEEVLRGFANGRMLIVRNGGHDDDLLISSTQIGDEIMKFLSRGGQTKDLIDLPALRFGR